MTRPRVMMIGWDGFEPTLAVPMLERGDLPNLRRLREIGANLALDHGAAKRTGLAWEHIATGLAPDDAQRWAAVDFDRDTYRAAQRPTSLLPFPAALKCRTVIFDPPYFDLDRATEVRGLVHWGAHDPGVARAARPDGLPAEILERFGEYPAERWIYGFVWPSADDTRAMADALVRAVDLRGEISQWLLGERLPDWDLGLVVVSEFHSAIEALWHGVDPDHPLAGLPSAEPAGVGVRGVYRAADRMLGRLMDLFPDAAFVLFNPHGMGANDSDVPSMALLPELLYRRSFGKPLLGRGDWATDARGMPILPGGAAWAAEVARLFPAPSALRTKVRRRGERMLAHLGYKSRRAKSPLNWMPAARYERYWPHMTAFALPSFYDGRIRINLKGREAKGRIAPDAYCQICDEIETLLDECRDPLSGKSVERVAGEPIERAPSDADLTVLWADAPLGLDHPRLGRIGPLPYRRPGGHTGAASMAHFAGPGIEPGDYGECSAFDVVPTVIDMLGEHGHGKISGASLLATIGGTAAGSASARGGS